MKPIRDFAFLLIIVAALSQSLLKAQMVDPSIPPPILNIKAEPGKGAILFWDHPCPNPWDYLYEIEKNYVNIAKVYAWEPPMWVDPDYGEGQTIKYRIRALRLSDGMCSEFSKDILSEGEFPQPEFFAEATSWNTVQLSWSFPQSFDRPPRFYDLLRYTEGEDANLRCCIDGHPDVYIDGSVLPGKTYIYRLRSWEEPDRALAEISVTTPIVVLPAPIGLIIIPQTSNSVKLHWDAYPSEYYGLNLEFEIQRKKINGTYSESILSNNWQEWFDTQNNAEDPFTYRIRVRSDYAISDWAEATLSAPESPQGIIITGYKENELRLRWHAAPGAQQNLFSYEVERKADDGPYEKLSSAKLVKRTYAGIDYMYFADKVSDSSKKYTYRVRSIRLGVPSEYAYTIVPFFISFYAPVDAPPLLYNLTNSTSLNLHWDPSISSHPVYRLERKIDNGDFGCIYESQKLPANYEEYMLIPGSTYTYRLWVIDSYGGSGYYDDVVIAISAGATFRQMSKPSSLELKNLKDKIAVRWNYGFSGRFEIERKNAQGEFVWIGAVSASPVYWYDDEWHFDFGYPPYCFEDSWNLVSGTDYTYRVRAESGGRYSEYSDEISFHYVALTKPTDFSATATSWSSVALAWDLSSVNNATYELERKTAGSEFTKIADLPANIANYTDTQLATLTTYTYRIRAKYGELVSDHSDEVEVTTPLPPPPPTPAGLQGGALGQHGATVTWNLSAGNGVSYELERKQKDGTFVKIADLAPGASSFEDSDLEPGSTYTYRMRAKGIGGYSSYSDEITITTEQVQLPTGVDMAIRLNDGGYLGINVTTWNVTPMRF